DDQNQSLTQAIAKAPAEANPNPNLPIARPAIVRAPVFLGGLHQIVAVRLNKGEKASKSLMELTGVIAAQILAPAAPAITVEKIMEAAGKEVKGAEGGRIKVIEVTKNPNGQIVVKFELEQPPNVFPANPFGPVNGPWIGPGGIRNIQNMPVPV